MQKLIPILLISILLIGCTTLTIEEKEAICKKECLSDGWEYGTFVGINFCNCYNSTMIINNTINNTSYINTTTQYNYTSSNRELELIRRIKFLEGQQDKYFNDSECNDNLNKTEIKLEDCEDEVCMWNNSWC